MIVTVASFKGGVSKTVTAIHIAAYLQQKAPALLIDGDMNRSATEWASRGKLPFKVADERQAARFAREYQHIVIDTAARPDPADLKALVEGCDLLIIPAVPDALALSATMLTTTALNNLGAQNYRLLLTMVPPRPSRDGEEARAMLLKAKLPVFKSAITRRAAFQKAALAGTTVSEVKDPRAKDAWQEYLKVGREILK